MSSMTWEEKLGAIKSLAPVSVSLHMREPGDWYVSAPMGIARNGMLDGAYGNGKSPEEAVENHWKIYSDPSVICKVRDKYYRWRGFMWVEVPEDEVR